MSWRRSRGGLALVVPAILGLVLVLSLGSASAKESEPVATPLAEPCAEFFICVYHQPEYVEINSVNPTCASGPTTITGSFRSAKNRCGNKSDLLKLNGTLVACMNPGGNRPNPGLFNELFVYGEYGAKC